MFYIVCVKNRLPVSSGVVSGPGSGSPPAVGRVSAKRHGDPGVSGLSLLPRHRTLHPAHRRSGAAAARPQRHRPAVPAARLLVSDGAIMSSFSLSLPDRCSQEDICSTQTELKEQRD